MESFRAKVAEFELKRSTWKAAYAFAPLMVALKAGFKPEQPRDELGRWTIEDGVEARTSPGFYTGIPSIDETSDALSNILKDIIRGLDFLPAMSPAAYGTFVHGLFAAAVRLKGLPGVGDTERTFSLEDADPYYGMIRSVRTDVTLRNIQGDVVAIYDVKTGDKQMSRTRADELRLKTGAMPGTPVFELNVARGISRKSICLRRRYLQ